MAQVRQTERESETSRKSATSDRAALSLLDNAKSLAPLFMANSVANEQNGALSDEVIEALHDGGLFGLFVPKCLGGFEAGPVDALAVIEAVSYADASTGWVMFAVGVANGSGAAYLHDDAIARIFRGDRFPVIAGQGIPNGKATAVKNGFQLSGNWSYGSGLKHAAYIHTGAIVFDNGAPRLDKAGNPEGRICVVPREQATLGDNWDVIGLRATGSIDYSINNVFVPEEYTHINHETRPLRGGALYSIGIIGLATLGHAAFALGVGRRALDEIAAVARAKSGSTGTLRE
ncbi:MAG: acyl-CoA dehydrogenase family protein, partial [Candidatus Binataceae bacterium]